jgi:hypothetical protein
MITTQKAHKERMRKVEVVAQGRETAKGQGVDLSQRRLSVRMWRKHNIICRKLTSCGPKLIISKKKS